MRYVLNILVIVIVTLQPCPALAECVTIEHARLDSTCVVMPYGEQRGVWFRLDKADELRKAHLELPELRKQVADYEQLVRIRDQQVGLLSDAAGQYRETIDGLGKVNAGLVTEAREAREARDKAIRESKRWYRSPFFWFGTGVATTIAIGLVAVYAAK